MYYYYNRVQDMDLSDLHPRKAFIKGAMDKEIRLSFAKRIRETLPESYHELVPASKEKDMPDFKYAKKGTGKCDRYVQLGLDYEPGQCFLCL